MSLPNEIVRQATGYKNVAATTAGNTTVFGAPTVACKIIVTSTGTGSGTFLTVYDSSSAASGNVIISVPSNAAAGTIYDLQVPVANGIVVAQVTNGPGLCVTYA